ncbi:MAG: CpaF family protein, partial [Chloroflexi bacterium]|nr:CpaF family protein [Chloroflexota bacterium]
MATPTAPPNGEERRAAPVATAPPVPPPPPVEVRRPPSPAAERASAISREIKTRVKGKLIAELDPNLDPKEATEVRQRLQSLFDQIVDGENIVLTRAERQRLFEEIAADVIGFGPIQPLLDDASINEVMVNGPTRVYVEKKGKLQLSGVTFDDDDHVRRIIERIVSPIGRRVDESSPICDARLPDGSRVNIVIPPISLIGSVITIRKFPKFRLGVEDLVRFGSLTPELAEFLRACVVARLNVIVSGGTGSG